MFFDAAKNFAVDLVEQLSKDIPSNLMAGQGKPLTVNRITRLLERTCAKACEYRDQNGLGMFARAVFANKFKWALRDRGYSEEFVATAVEAVLVSLSKK